MGLSPSAITSLSYCHGPRFRLLSDSIDSINGDRLLLSCMDHSLEVYDGEILVSIKTLKYDQEPRREEYRNKNMKIENLCNQAILRYAKNRKGHELVLIIPTQSQAPQMVMFFSSTSALEKSNKY